VYTARTAKCEWERRGKGKRSDHYSALGFPGKIAEDLRGAIV